MRHVLVSLLVGAAVLSASAAIGQTPATLAQSATPAPDVQRLALARRLMELTTTDEDMLKGIRLGMESVAQASGSDDEPAAGKIDEYMSLVAPKVREYMPRINEARAQVYAHSFSAEELRQLVAFADSAAGKRYLSGMFEIENEPTVEAANEALMKALQDVAKEQCRKRAAHRVAAGDTKAKCPLSAQSATGAG